MTTPRRVLIALVTPGLLVVGAHVTGIAESRADTAKFPDLSTYTPVNASDYQVDASTPGMPATRPLFLTPDGIQCKFRQPQAAGCVGPNFPGVPSPNGALVNSIGTDNGLHQTNESYPRDNTIGGQPIRTLPPFHSITVDGVTCGVDDAGTTACKDPLGRGFVLSPNGSGWLPHV